MIQVRDPNHRDAARSAGALAGHEGVAFVATLRGTPGRDVLDTALDALRNLHHGRSQAAGVLTHIPDRLLRTELGSDLPPVGHYAVGFVFHQDPHSERTRITEAAAAEGFAVLTWREVPLNDTIVGIAQRRTMPTMSQVILTPADVPTTEEFDAGLYRVRKRVEAHSGAYFASLSRTTIVYKGLVPASRLALLYTDLADPLYRTEIAVVHSCCSSIYTQWQHAQPHRILAHDGQIHSAAANRTWLQARLPMMSADVLSGVDLQVSPHHLPEGALDEYVELLHRTGRSLTHALRLVIPEQWGRRMGAQERDFYNYAATVAEPWEGSGVTCFADGYLVGAVLDRHGTTSGRYWVTETGLVVFASETGVVDLDPSRITKKGRLAPGELIAVDTVVGNLLPSDAVRAQIAAQHPYGQWLSENLRLLEGTGAAEPELPAEEVAATYHIAATATTVARLADDAPAPHDGAVPRHLRFFDRFRTRRSQLTTPYIDPLTMPPTPRVFVGPEHNILTDGAHHARKVVLPGPAITTADLEEVAQHLRLEHLDATARPGPGGQADLSELIETLRRRATEAVAQGVEVLAVSNRRALSGEAIPVPSILAIGAVHQHLLSAGLRARVSLIAVSGEAVEPGDIARLLQAGAEAVVPFGGTALAGAGRVHAYMSELNAGVYRRVLASGSGSYRAFQGNKGFHIIGLSTALVDEFFTGAERALGTFGLPELTREIAGPPIPLAPLQDLLDIPSRDPIDLDCVEPAEAITARITDTAPLVIDVTRQGVDLLGVATSRQLLLAPPAHHDSVGTDALRLLINELRKINHEARIHVRVGADLTSDLTAIEAITAGADVINLVDGEYEWVFGLLSLRQSELLHGTTIAVGTPLRTARDLFIAAALGASEFTLHPNAETAQVVAELRTLLARAGIPTLTELAGRADALDWSEAISQWQRVGVDLAATGRRRRQHTLVERAEEPEPLGRTLAGLARESIDTGAPARINAFVANTDVSIGAFLAGEIARKHGPGGLAEDTIRLTLTGSAGPSLGAFAAPGVTIIVQGEAGDFVGKSLSGGKIIVRPENTASFYPQENVIAGSAIGYGANSGEIYLAGEVGERLGAHNRGATIVCEGAGDLVGHRMHAGTVVILGEVGVHLGAGMTGGVIYALDLPPDAIHSGRGATDLLAASLDDTDLRVLTAVLAEHVERTQSRVATLLLTEPDELNARFTKIHPVGCNPESNISTGPVPNVWDRVLGATTTTEDEKAQAHHA